MELRQLTYFVAVAEVDIVCREDTSERLIDEVGWGAADVAFVAPVHEDWPGGIGAELVDRERAVLLVRGDHPLARRAAVCLADLRDERFVALAPGTVPRPGSRGSGGDPSVPRPAALPPLPPTPVPAMSDDAASRAHDPSVAPTPPTRRGRASCLPS